MKHRASPVLRALLALSLGGLLAASASANDVQHFLPIDDVLNEYRDRLDDNIALSFGSQSHGEIVENHGEFSTSKKTNAFRKADDVACRWVMLSALLTLQERAVLEGGNAVVNIRSNYEHKQMSSETEYECHAGRMIAGVALIGEVVTIEY